MSIILNIARNTWRECLRQPIFVILLICALSIIGFYPGVALFVFRSQQKMVIDGSLATIMVFSLMAAVLCSSHTVSREISTGTVLLVLSKPVSRDAFITAKIMGVLAAITLFAWTTSLAALISLKAATDQFRFDPWLMSGVFAVIAISCIIGAGANYYGKRSFSAACAKSLGIGMSLFAVVAFFLPTWDSSHYKWAQGSSYFDMNVCREIILIIFAAWAMATMATALSTRFNLMSNMTICLVIFVLGLMSDWMNTGLRTMKLSDVEIMMHSWYYIFFPILMLLWLMSSKHFGHRRNTRIRAWEVHLSYALLTVGLVGKTIADNLANVQLDEPSAWMKTVALGLFKLKHVAADVLYAAIPNWQQFWLADAVAANKTIPVAYIGMAAGYIAMFIISFIILAIILFTGREVGAQEGNV